MERRVLRSYIVKWFDILRWSLSPCSKALLAFVGFGGFTEAHLEWFD